jgi:hypothetical protein
MSEGEFTCGGAGRGHKPSDDILTRPSPDGSRPAGLRWRAIDPEPSRAPVFPRPEPPRGAGEESAGWVRRVHLWWCRARQRGHKSGR